MPEFLGTTKIFWNWMMVMVAQFYEYTKNRWTAHFNRMKFVVCESYVNFSRKGNPHRP